MPTFPFIRFLAAVSRIYLFFVSLLGNSRTRDGQPGSNQVDPVQTVGKKPGDDVEALSSASPTDSIVGSKDVLSEPGTDGYINPPLLSVIIDLNPTQQNKQVSEKKLRSIVPCWERADEIGEGSACSITTNRCRSFARSFAFRFSASRIIGEVDTRARELWRKFKADGDGFWLRRGIHILDHVIAIPHTNDAKLLPLLYRRAVLCRGLFETTGNDFQLDKSIGDLQAVVDLLPRGATRRHNMLERLGYLLNIRFNKTGNREDLDQAIEADRQALEGWPQEATRPIEMIVDLGTALRKRFWIGRNVSDLESAIHHWEELLPSLGDDHPHQLLVLSNLGSALIDRFRVRGKSADLDHGIYHLEEALALEDKDGSRRPRILQTLADALKTRYLMSKQESDVDDAIHHHREVLSFRIEDHPDRPISMNNLSSALHFRYLEMRDVCDLEEAIHHLEGAIPLFKQNDSRLPMCLDNLAGMLCDRFLISNDVTDLDEAVGFHEHALSFRPGNHPDRPHTLRDLGQTLLARFMTLWEESDGRKAIHCFSESLRLYPSGHPDRQTSLSKLFVLLPLFPLGNLPNDILTDLLGSCTELAKLNPPAHPGYSSMAAMVAPLLPTFSQKGLDIHQLLITAGLDPDSNAEDATFAVLEKGSRAPTSPSKHQLFAACEWITSCRALKRPCTLDMYARMFDLLDLSVARGCSFPTGRKHLSEDSAIQLAQSLVPEAVAFAIRAGVYETAVEWLERSQSALAQLSRRSSVLGALRSVRPDLAARFEDLSEQVECPVSNESGEPQKIGPKDPLKDMISTSDRLTNEWDGVVKEIRTVDGFKHFLRPTPFAILQQATAEGPFIFVNITKSRSDAIIVTPDRPPTIVPLPFATPDHVEQVLVPSFRALAKSGSHGEAKDTLKALWEAIVQPIVGVLQDTLNISRNSPIWWCLPSTIASLPLHLAGNYQHPSECLTSLYISSYTPSLAALIRLREKDALGTEVVNAYAIHDKVLSAVQKGLHLASQGLVRGDSPPPFDSILGEALPAVAAA